MPDIFRVVAGLGTGVSEKQMYHLLLLRLLWGQISWGQWGESNSLNQHRRNLQGPLNPCFGSLGWSVTGFFYNVHFEINTSRSKASFRTRLEKGQTADVPITIINHRQWACPCSRAERGSQRPIQLQSTSQIYIRLRSTAGNEQGLQPLSDDELAV